MMKGKIVLIILSILLLGVSPALADRYYCFSVDSQGHAVGDDSNTGYGSSSCSSASHWYKTIQKINDITDNLGATSETIYILGEENDIWNFAGTGSSPDFESTEPLSSESARIKVSEDGTTSGRIIYGACDSSGNHIPQTTDWVSRGTDRPKIDYGYYPVDAYKPAVWWNPGKDYITIENWWIYNIGYESLGTANSNAIRVTDDSGVDTPYYTHIINNKINKISGDPIGIRSLREGKIDSNIIFDGVRVRGPDETPSPSCGFTGGSAINVNGISSWFNRASRLNEITNNIVYDHYGECIGLYYNGNDNNPNLVQGNVTWNCRSSHQHATGSSVLNRWNLAGTYDSASSGSGAEPTWDGDYGTWPNCKTTTRSGKFAQYDVNDDVASTNHQSAYGNLIFGSQMIASEGGYATGLGLGPSVREPPQDEGYSRVIKNTVVDSWQNITMSDKKDSPGANNIIYFNVSVFYDTPDTNWKYCSAVDWYNELDFNFNWWGATPTNSICQGANDLTGDAQLEQQTGSNWRWPSDMATITWQDFAPLYSSGLVNPSNTAYAAIVADADSGSGTSLYVDWPHIFWPGDYIAINTATNITQVTAVDYSTGILTISPGLSRSDGQKVHLNVYKWDSKTQSSSAGWWGASQEWGGVENPVDVAPTNLALANCTGNEDCDASGEATFTRNAQANQTDYPLYATDWKIVLPESSCDGSPIGSNEGTCETTTPTSLSYSGLSENTSYKLCVRTYVDWDGGSDCDSTEASLGGIWTTANFTVGEGAGPPTAYGGIMSATPLGYLGSALGGAPMSVTPADCGGAPCGGLMGE